MTFPEPNPVRESLQQGQLTIVVLRGEATCVVKLVGELDLDSAPTLERELDRLIAVEPEILVVDLERLRFIDSSGLSCLFEAGKVAASNGDVLRFRGATGHVEEMLELTDIKKLLRFID